MPKILSIPFRINALWLSKDVTAATASADFREVPFIDKKGLTNYPDKPFISENMVAQPFENGHQLEKGVHLHFDIPIAFKTAQKLEKKRIESYPPLPNRWLVTKNNEEKWIIESDYLWAESDNSKEKLDAVNVLLPKYKAIDNNGTLIENTEIYSRCRHVGRKYNAADYPKNDNGKYWKDYFNGEGITAIGYGEPTFVGFYPNCKSVFGFYDANGKADDQYEVIGWYENKADLTTILNTFNDNKELEKHLYFSDSKTFETNKQTILELGKRFEKLNESEKEDFRNKYSKYLFIYENSFKGKNPTFQQIQDLEIRYNKVKAFENAYSVNYAKHSENLILPEQLLFFSKIQILGSGQTKSTGHTIDDATIGIGNSGREALNALKAQQQYKADKSVPKKKSKAEIENDLELIHFDSLLDKKTDLMYEFNEERHKKSFSPIEGGRYWKLDIVLSTEDNLTTDNDLNTSLKNLLNESGVQILHKALLNRINELNGLKIQYNKKQREIASQQHQLFADWYKYMLTAHPPINDADSYIPADNVMRFINRFVIRNIYDSILETDVITKENNKRQRRTIENLGLNSELNIDKLKQLKITGNDSSILGKILNILIKNSDVTILETNTLLVQSKDFFNKMLSDFTALQLDFTKLSNLLDRLNKIKVNPKLLDSESPKNPIINELKTRKIITNGIENWQKLYNSNNTFEDLKVFFDKYKNNVSKVAKDVLKPTLQRLDSIEKEYTKALRLYKKLDYLEFYQLNRLLHIIIQLTNDITVRNTANILLNQTGDNRIDAAKIFINKHLKNVFIKDVQQAILYPTVEYNTTNLAKAIDKIIKQEEDYRNNYYFAQFKNIAQQTQKLAQELLIKIDKKSSAFAQITALLAALKETLNVENLIKVKSKLVTLQTTINAIKEVNHSYNEKKSILQLLIDFEGVMQRTILTLLEEKKDDNGNITYVKKYAKLENEPILIRLMQRAEASYYEAKEPVILLEATGLNPEMPTSEQGEATYNEQVLVELPNINFNNNLADIEAFKKQKVFEQLQYLKLKTPFWKPLNMDWKVDYFAVNDPRNEQKYDASFVEKTFVINDDQPELRLRKEVDLEKIIIGKAGRTYSGSTILSPHAVKLVREKLKSYSQNKKQKESKKVTQSSRKKSPKLIDKLLQKIEDKPKSTKTTGETYAEKLQNQSEKIRKMQETPGLALGKDKQIKTAQKQIKKEKQKQLNSSVTNVLDSFDNGNNGANKPQKAILSQSLGGFNQCLLMRKQTMQLEVDDPIALDDYRPMIKVIRDFIGREKLSAPEPKNFFNPIRSGLIRITDLRIVDTFGQTASIDFKRTEVGKSSEIVVTETLIAEKLISESRSANESIQKEKIERKGYDAFLPTRIVQPMRLNLRWLSNTDNSESINQSPICGWIVPNFLNETIALFTNEGELLGDIGLVRDANDIADIRLLPKPGAHSFYDFEITNKYLRNLAKYFIKKGAEWFNKFMKNINQTIVYSDPEGFEQHTGISMLVGKPLALVRSKIGFQSMENHAINQDWTVFEEDVKKAFSTTYKRATYEFEKVKFPLKVGNAKQLNDGLFGFWLEEEETFHPVLQTKGFDNSNILQKSIEEAPTKLTMLFDPRGKLNAFSGILPTKTIIIPPELYADALKKMKIYFSVGPFITPKSKLQIPIPQSKVYEWKWVYESDDHLVEISTEPTIEKSILEIAWKKEFDEPFGKIWRMLLRSNWLKPIENEVAQAYVNFDDNTRQPLPRIEGIADNWSNKVDRMLNENYRGVTHTTDDVVFGQFELREGWLKLMNEI